MAHYFADPTEVSIVRLRWDYLSPPYCIAIRLLLFFSQRYTPKLTDSSTCGRTCSSTGGCSACLLATAERWRDELLEKFSFEVGQWPCGFTTAVGPGRWPRRAGSCIPQPQIRYNMSIAIGPPHSIACSWSNTDSGLETAETTIVSWEKKITIRAELNVHDVAKTTHKALTTTPH